MQLYSTDTKTVNKYDWSYLKLFKFELASFYYGHHQKSSGSSHHQ